MPYMSLINCLKIIIGNFNMYFNITQIDVHFISLLFEDIDNIDFVIIIYYYYLLLMQLLLFAIMINFV